MNQGRTSQLIAAAIFILTALSSASAQTDDSNRVVRLAAVKGTLATYCRAPHLPDGRADIHLLLEQLADLHANTYSFCIHGTTNDWADLQLFLPLARKQGLLVWGSVVPPSESPPKSKRFAEPFRLDYERWAVEFAKLSLRETNLIAWSIDDFSHNLKVYTPAHLKKMLDAAHQINPRLAFVPCCYYPAITSQFVKDYEPLLDGILFPYRHDSNVGNLKDSDLAVPELQSIKTKTSAGFPIVLDVYATAHSKLGKSTPEYVEQVMIAGHAAADGVMVYCHQDPKNDPEKYQIIKKLFTIWQNK